MTSGISSRVSALGVGSVAGALTALEETSSQASQSSISDEGVSGAPPSHGRNRRALRPEWPSWMPGTALCSLMKSTQRFSPGTNASSHRPRSPTVPQPRRSTLVDSMMTRPAPPAAYRPAFIRCQSVAKPLIAEYWCIGATTTLFFKVTSRIEIDSNSFGCAMYTPPMTAIVHDRYDDTYLRGILRARSEEHTSELQSPVH